MRLEPLVEVGAVGIDRPSARVDCQQHAGLLE